MRVISRSIIIVYVFDYYNSFRLVVKASMITIMLGKLEGNMSRVSLLLNWKPTKPVQNISWKESTPACMVGIRQSPSVGTEHTCTCVDSHKITIFDKKPN